MTYDLATDWAIKTKTIKIFKTLINEIVGKEVSIITHLFTYKLIH